jgi:hypothetical protein
MTATSVCGISFAECHPPAGASRQARTTALLRFTPIANSTPLSGSGSRREFHPPAPTDPGVTVSGHRALVILITRRREPISSA